jgi:deazaflavin-dependent oxidoreductase (nitroreductase family)
MTSGRQPTAALPARPIIRAAWALHRALYRFTGGRVGLRRPEAGNTFGMLRLTTIGRLSGKPRVAIVGYYDDGENLVSLAMNGWGKDDPFWWLNLRSNPEAVVVIADGTRAVRARAAVGPERERLWAKVGDFPGWGEHIDALAAGRPLETTVVVFEPWPRSEEARA